MEAVHRAGKKAFIAGTTVSGKSPKNWQQCINVGMDSLLTDYPLDLRAIVRQKNSQEMTYKSLESVNDHAKEHPPAHLGS